MAHALDVIDQSGIALRGGGADADVKWREVTRHGVVAVDDLQQGLLFAEQVTVGAQDNSQEAARRAPGCLELGSRLLQPLDRMGEFFLDADDRRARAHGVGSDEHPLENPIRIFPQKISVLVSARLAFGGVTHNVFGGAGVVKDGLPFDARWETRPAAPAQTALFDKVNRLLGRKTAGLLQTG